MTDGEKWRTGLRRDTSGIVRGTGRHGPRGKPIPRNRSDYSVVLTETTIEELGTRMLALTEYCRYLGAHIAAAAAHGLGKHEMAASLIDIAEAAERLWLDRYPVRLCSGL